MADREHFTNGRCLTGGTGLTLVLAAFATQIAGWSHWIGIGMGYGAGLVLMLMATVWITRSYYTREHREVHPSLQTTGSVPGIPTLSGILGQNSSPNFNARQFFALAYYSPVTAEVEKNIKVIAQQSSPNDKEAFYARFIGIGVTSYLHDITWFTIFGSQLAALAELNSHGQPVPLTDIKKHYDKATVSFPKAYEGYTFEQWTEFMKSRSIITIYASGMTEVSFGGKDFLKYVAHMGWDTSAPKN